MSDNPEVISGVDYRTKRRGSLTATIGLPASGKSTWAEQVRRRFPDRVRIVCRDDIREMTGARYEDGDEPTVARIRDNMIEAFLVLGYDVICTDTNISAKVRRRLANLAKHRKADYSEIPFLTPIEVCIERNDKRWEDGDCKVPNSAIYAMAAQWIDRPCDATSVNSG